MTTSNLTEVKYFYHDTKKDSARVKMAVLDVSSAFCIPAFSPFLTPPQKYFVVHANILKK